MSESNLERFSRDVVLAALTDSGRELSTAAILYHTNLAKRVGLGPSEEKVLELVHRHRDVTVSELAAHVGMRKNSLSDILDRLEEKGFVERGPHPSDGRKVSIIGTASGSERLGALFGDLMSQLGELNADYTTEELAVVADYQRRAAEIQTTASHALANDAEPRQRRRTRRA